MLKELYKKFILRYGSVMLAFVFCIGQLSTNMACKCNFYQPEVPKELMKR